jgi:hypothetical protein
LCLGTGDSRKIARGPAKRKEQHGDPIPDPAERRA